MLRYLLRIVNILISTSISIFAYKSAYIHYLNYLPDIKILDYLNNTTTNLSSILRDNSIGFRELYYHASEKSVIFAIIVFIISFSLIEYVYRSSNKKRENSLKTVYERLGAYKERKNKSNGWSKEKEQYVKDKLDIQ